MKDDSARDKAMDKLVEAKLRSGLEPGSPGCLDVETLAAYVEQALTARERANCESHLVSCAQCQEHVAMLVRLGEADEPAGIQTKTTAPARAGGIGWFRWAWAGPTLAALLVIGIYIGGPFRQNIQQIPGPENRIQTPVRSESAPSARVAEGGKNEPALPADSGTGTAQRSPSAENKTLDSQSPKVPIAGKPQDLQTKPARVNDLGGISAPKAPVAKTQYDEMTRTQPTAGPQPLPAPAANNVAPGVAGGIAVPSERAALAKDERGQGAGAGGSAAQGAGGGTISGITSNQPSAHQAMGNFSIAGRKAQSIASQTAPPAVNEKTSSGKSALQDEAKAKKEAQTTDAERADLFKDGDKHQISHSVAQSGAVPPAEAQMEVTSKVVAPLWRVGRHGLIQKRNAGGKWKKQNSGVEADLFAIAFSRPDVGWVAGQAGTLLRTTDGGTTWSQVPGPATEDLVQVTAASDQAASVVTRSGLTFTTTDGGNSWSAGGR